MVVQPLHYVKISLLAGAVVDDIGRACLAEPDGDVDEARTPRPPQAATITLDRTPCGGRSEFRMPAMSTSTNVHAAQSDASPTAANA